MGAIAFIGALFAFSKKVPSLGFLAIIIGAIMFFSASASSQAVQTNKLTTAEVGKLEAETYNLESEGDLFLAQGQESLANATATLGKNDRANSWSNEGLFFLNAFKLGVALKVLGPFIIILLALLPFTWFVSRTTKRQ